WRKLRNDQPLCWRRGVKKITERLREVWRTLKSKEMEEAQKSSNLRRLFQLASFVLILELDLVSSAGKPSTKWLKTDYFVLDEGLVVSLNLTPSAEVFENKTVLVQLNLRDETSLFWSQRVPIITHKEPVRTAYNLLSGMNKTGDESASSSSSEPSPPGQPDDQSPVSFWLSTLRVFLLRTPVVFNLNTVAAELVPHIRPTSDKRSQRPVYLPVVYVNPLMQPSADWTETPVVSHRDEQEYPTMKFTVSVEPQSIGKFRLRCMLGMMAEQLRSYGFKQKDIDDVRQLFLDTNFYFLVTTMFVSVCHILFDFLAFKNDISFWRKAKNTTGLSMRTVVWRFVSSFIIFLHLCEERSSLLVIVPMGISTCIELWKLARLTKFSFSFKHGFHRGQRSKAERETDELDAQFMFWLQILLIPLCLAGSIYSLLYTPHRSWYSWCLQTLVHGVYAFGFLFMTPQLFINYRLKSVAHLPWKALTYKAFNTFIDDFFAMIITMPTSHRIACLRDDVIFLIYLYQRWLYPVDKSRVNEFGQRGDHEDDDGQGDVKTILIGNLAVSRTWCFLRVTWQLGTDGVLTMLMV
ncbi:hypothetical protein T265_13841, partial [Opisthorchis viverrini]